MVHARGGAARWLCGATRVREEPIKKEGGTARDGRLIDLHVAVHVYISAMSLRTTSARAQQLRHYDGGGGGPAAVKATRYVTSTYHVVLLTFLPTRVSK